VQKLMADVQAKGKS